MTDWLRFNGYDISDIVPLLSPTKEQAFTCGSNGLLYVSSECYLEKKIASFHTLLSVHRSPLLPDTPFDRRVPLSFSPASTIYGDGLVVANRSRMANVYVSEAIDRPSADPMVALLNQSSILPLSYVQDGGSISYLWKKETDKANSDWTSLGLKTQNGWVPLTAATNATLNSVTGSDGGPRRELVIAAPASRLTVRYGGLDSDSETRQLLQETLAKVAERRWTVEKAKALRNSASKWTDRELAELKEKGRIDGYSAEFRRDPLSHPALLMDPNNVRFVKR